MTTNLGRHFLLHYNLDYLPNNTALAESVAGSTV